MSERGLAKAMKTLYVEGGRGYDGANLVFEGFQRKKFDIKDFSLKALAIETCGERWFETLRPGRGPLFIESAPVDASAFANLANVVLTGLIWKEFQEADINVGDQYATTEDVPFIQQGRDIQVRRTDAVSTVVKEGRSFPRFGLSENWRMYPDTEKRGGIIELTREAISEDRTGQIMDQARTVADEVVMDKNERILKVVLGISNNVYLPQGVASTTYETSDTTRINVQTSNELVDWTNVEKAWLLWAAMAHPVTGRPIVPPPEDSGILVMPFKRATALRIFRATTVQVGERVATAGNAGVSTSENPISDLLGNMGMNKQGLVASQLAYYLLTLASAKGGGGISTSNAQKYWFIGAFKRAFCYKQNYPLMVITRGAGTEAEFDRDVLFQIRASERGVMTVREPRYVIKCTG